MYLGSRIAYLSPVFAIFYQFFKSRSGLIGSILTVTVPFAPFLNSGRTTSHHVPSPLIMLSKEREEPGLHANAVNCVKGEIHNCLQVRVYVYVCVRERESHHDELRLAVYDTLLLLHTAVTNL